MSDLIDRQAAIEAFRKELCREREYAISFKGCERVLSKLPSVQPEIIRCKDCRRYLPPHGCGHLDGMTTSQEDGFCSYAEPKGEQE